MNTMIRSQNMTDHRWVKKQSLGFRSGGIVRGMLSLYDEDITLCVVLIKNRLENDNMKIKCEKLIEL